MYHLSLFLNILLSTEKIASLSRLDKIQDFPSFLDWVHDFVGESDFGFSGSQHVDGEYYCHNDVREHYHSVNHSSHLQVFLYLVQLTAEKITTKFVQLTAEKITTQLSEIQTFYISKSMYTEAFLSMCSVHLKRNFLKENITLTSPSGKFSKKH